MAARADNGMDPFTVLGISARAVRKKEDLYKLRHRCKSLIDGYLVKRQGSNARRVKWAFDQIKSKFSGQGRQEPSAEGQVPGPSPEAAPSASPAASPAAASPTDPPVDRRDAIRNKAAARRERTATGEEDPETAKRRETIREKLAVKRMLKQVQTLKEEEAKQKVVHFLAAPPSSGGAGPPERVSLTCPLSGVRLRLPGRGMDCKHLQCFDLEHFLTGKGSPTALCPVCSCELALPGGLFVDSYVAKILSTVGEKVKDVTFTSNGAYSVARPKAATATKAATKTASRPAPEAAVAAGAAATSAGLGTTAAAAAPKVAKRPREEPKPAEVADAAPPATSAPRAESTAEQPQGKAAAAPATADGAAASKEVSGQKQAEKTEKPSKPKPKPKPEPTPEQLREEAAREEKRKRAKLYHTLRAEELADPTNEANYIVVELPTTNMGLILRPNPSTIGGAFVEAIDRTGATARHGGLKAGDQLVGIGNKLVIGQDLDACIDLIVPDSRGAARLTVFRGSASSLYGKGHSRDWLTGFMSRVAAGEVDLTLPAPEPDPDPEESPEPDPDPDPEPEPPTPEPTPPPEKKKKNPRLSMSSEESGSDSEADDDFSLELSGAEEDSEGESPSAAKPPALPERLGGQITGAGLDADLESCLEAVRAPPADGTPEHLPAEPRLLARAIIKACIAGNLENWTSLDEQDQAAWRLSARKRLVRAAGERADRLEARRRQQIQDSQRSSLAEVAATAASRQGGGLEDPAEAMQEEEPLLRVQPEKAIKFDHNRTAQLTLRSHSSSHVAFRVRTSAPKFIFVQPCAGTLQPGEWVSLQVCSSERHVTAAGDLKFLVQAVAAPDAEIMSKEKWAVLDSSAIQDWNLVGRL